MLTKMINDYLTDREPRQKDGYYHPSQISQCPRALYYKEKLGYQETHDGKTHRIFDNGTYTHLRIQKYLAKIGVLYGFYYSRTHNKVIYKNDMNLVMGDKGPICNRDNIKTYIISREEALTVASDIEYSEVPLINEEYNLKGNCDGILKIDNEFYLLEIKTMNNNGFTYLKQPLQSHLNQITLYNYMTGINKTLVLYENKDNQEFKEYVVDYDEQRFNFVMSTIEELTSALNGGPIPKKMCKSRASTMYKRCPFRVRCFDGME